MSSTVLPTPAAAPDHDTAAPPPAAAAAGDRPAGTIVIPPRTGGRRRTGRYGRLLRVLVPIALVGVWQLVCSTGLVSERTIESPSTIWSALAELWDDGILQESIAASLGRAAKGFAIGLVIGLVLGLATGLSKLGERLLDASVQMLRTVPFLALIPLFMIWFGIDEAPKVALVAAACTFSVYVNTFAGVRGVDPELIEAARTFGLSRWATVRHVTLPLALPTLLVGVRYSLGVSLLALVAAEQVNTRSGLGYIVMDARNSLRIDIVMAGILVYAVLGIGVDLLGRALAHLLMPWHVDNVGVRDS